ncbi:MAG: hypothetical protein LAO76_27375 [Acidobacteriia bacterium]|nr:hypothetical protein [Terriglobia bacterium]
MSSLIVIRIVPETAVDAGTFTNYLTALGGLRIRAFDLSFNSPTTGQNVGTATYIAPTTPPSPTSPVLFTLPAPGPTIKPPKYPAGTTNGIVQQYDQVPGQSLGPITESSFFELKSVATAVIQVSAPTAFENLRLEVQWGSGAGSQSIPVTTDYYDVALAPGPSPNPNFWAALPPSLYLSLPAPPASANAVSVSLPSDGTPPPFDSLLSAVKGVLNLDPGGTPDIGKLTPDQCRNIAYEIVWGQQKPVPAAPDRIEDLYTNPPNKGVFLSGSTPNQLEADRQQFEANLKSYYTTADATADRLTNYVYSLAAAVACEEQCLKARQAILDFPANPSQAGPTPTSSTEIILTAFGGVNPPVNFGVPAAYFYALGASMPPQITPTQRFRMASGDKPQHVLAQLTAAINARTVSDAEKFATLPAAPSINAAQAARRIIALGVPVGSTTPLAPLDTITLQTSGDTPAGSTLPFSSTTGVSAGMSITGANIPADTTVLGVTTTSVTMSQPVSGDVPKGASIIFTPAFSADLRQLVQAWLAYPPSAAPPAPPSSQTYQPDDDAAQFWPGAATAHASAFLNLVLCALTKGYFIPAPVNASLGDKIVSGLLAPLAALPTIATLASVTDEQWNGFFQKNPTWLPPFTKPGNTAARTAAFIRYAQKFFAVVAAGPPSSINVATSAATLLGNVLHFTSTAGIAAKMSVAATNLPSGTIPGGTTVTGVTATSVTLSQPLAGTVPSGANITFTPNFLSGTSRTLPLLQAPSTDWLSVCLGFYGAYTLGSGFDVDKLTAAAAQVFADDQEAQDWLVDALVTIDSLYQILNSVPLPPTNPKNFEFSLAEALYARGFTSAEDITELSSADFQQALTGTVAYDLAGDIYDSAAKIAPPEPTPPPPGDGFQPVNPDGSLTNCIPPACLSPLGPVAYLSDMLRASENSTCDDPFASPDEEHTTLGGAIAGRRNLGGLEATCANLETPIPLIDIVNECLENLAVETPSTAPVAYNTSATTVAGHDLCKENHCTDELKDDCCSEEHNKDEHCHKPASLLATLPEHSSPATPVAQPGAYDRLKSDFSSCCLPYSQPLDLARSYLAHMRTCRHEDMRTFRKNITEFALDSSLAPPVFQAHLWRYPVRIEIAIEYLGLTPEEYAALFNPGDVATATLYGFGANDEGWTETVVQLPEFLKRTCLTYCEFVELQRALQGSQIVEFVSGDEKGFFPDCEPCCLGEYEITFASPQDTPQALRRLAIFIRVWRKLKEVCGARYCFAELRDICEVLGLFTNTGINPNFIRQLAAFQILRDQFTMPLADRTDQQAGATDAERSHLLALWVGPAAPKWNWAVEHLLARVQHHAQLHHKAARRLPEFIKLLAENLDPLSRLAGFDPDRPSDTWHARPANTLRFAEVLAKISASHFSVGEIVFLFTADEHLDGDDPFPLQELNEALDSPLGLPDDEHEHSLLALRRKLLSIRVPEEEAREWTWHRIEASLRSEFGYAPPAGSPDALTSLAEHFFPHILESYGQMVDAKKRQYRVDLAGTPPLMWNTPADGPFRYDASAQQLWTKLPLQDEAVIEKLSSMRQLTPAEQQAVQDLYYLPRLDLVPFAFLFADFRSADERLIQEKNEEERWTWFRGHFALAHARCRIIAEHLACHAQNESERQWEDANETAWLILKRLFADENRAASSWEDDSGKVPQVTWTPQPNGGAFAALLGLTGTGLLGEFTPIQGGVGYREVPGPMRAFGHDRNRKNCPVPTVLPTMDLTLTPAQASFITARNGFAMKDEHGTALGGAQGFTVHWTGVLLVDKEGRYEFRAGAPTPEGEKPDFEAAEHRQWKVTLKRGQKTWVLLRHHWEEEEPQHTLAVALKCGAYHITVEFTEPAPRFTHEEGVRPLHTGFEIKYTGPDSDDRWIALPLHQLFRETKDDTLQQGIDTLSGKAADFLQQQFTSTLRDIRRTYQRAFKALLFAIGFELSGKRAPHYGQSELGYMLDDADLFAGVSYYRDPTLFSKHLANFDFNFLPLRDNYQPPAPVQDLRVQPTVKREQALFDWWERSFDYVQMREQTKSAHQHPLWLLFEEATEQQPDNAGHLLRHMDVDFRYAQAVLHYFIDQTVPLYEVTSNDLKDDRWAVRVWHSNQFVRRLVRHFHVNDLRDARPYLWASDDPGMAVSGETRSGNENLTKFVCDGRETTQ